MIIKCFWTFYLHFVLHRVQLKNTFKILWRTYVYVIFYNSFQESQVKTFTGSLAHGIQHTQTLILQSCKIVMIKQTVTGFKSAIIFLLCISLLSHLLNILVCICSVVLNLWRLAFGDVTAPSSHKSNCGDDSTASFISSYEIIWSYQGIIITPINIQPQLKLDTIVSFIAWLRSVSYRKRSREEACWHRATSLFTSYVTK